jgi:flagella basal body P-ring formation protein FlgA
MVAKYAKSILAVGLAALTITAGAATRPQADVLVKPSVEIAAPDAKLCDIATIQCSNKTLASKLEAVPICPTPLPGYERRVTRDQIIIAMRRRGITDETVNLICSHQITITRLATSVTGQALFEVVKDYIIANSSFPGTFTVEPILLPADQKVPIGSLELRVKQSGQSIRKGRNTIPVEIVVDGVVKNTSNISINIRIFASVMVATTAIPRSEAITNTNTTMQEREITSLPDDIVVNAPTSDVTATVAIANGEVIRSNWIATPPVVRSGDTVTVLVTGKYVRVSDKGTATSDGRTGDRIKVRLGSMAREVRGTVVSPGLIEISLDGGN